MHSENREFVWSPYPNQSRLGPLMMQICCSDRRAGYSCDRLKDQIYLSVFDENLRDCRDACAGCIERTEGHEEPQTSVDR